MKPVFKTLIISFLGNCVLVILKYVVGIITNTQVLLADAIHSLSDLITDVVAIIGSKMSYKKSDIKHPKGYGRIQYVTNLIMGVVILLLSININTRTNEKVCFTSVIGCVQFSDYSGL